MIIFPAIDLKDGKCVRLEKGDMNKATSFNDSPADQSAKFEQSGCSWLHIVDLNGAFEGRPVNAQAVESIIANCNLNIQLGGGIRDIATIEKWLSSGVSRVILGTAALKNPDLVIEACKLYEGKVAVGIDAKSGMVAVQGWAEDSDVHVIDLARKFEDVGVAAIIYTDIERDGIMVGPDLGGTKKLAQAVNIPIIASGGIASLDDLQKISDLEEYGVIGAISGRAIYDGKINLKEAIEKLC